jgi:hypothetical protein
MTNRQENTFTMMKTTNETISRKAATDGMPPALKTVNDNLTDKLREIEVKDQGKGILTSGKTNVKKQAAAMANEMAELLSKATVGKENKSPARIIRDKAYMHLKEAVDEIRSCGQFVFWIDESRSKGYVSRYFKHSRSRSKTKTADTGETINK